MQWARDGGAEHHAALIKSVTSLLTATTRVMVVGMDADPIAQTTLDIVETVPGIAMTTLTAADGDAAIATVISTIIAVGDAIGKASRELGQYDNAVASGRCEREFDPTLPRFGTDPIIQAW